MDAEPLPNAATQVCVCSALIWVRDKFRMWQLCACAWVRVRLSATKCHNVQRSATKCDYHRTMCHDLHFCFHMLVHVCAVYVCAMCCVVWMCMCAGCTEEGESSDVTMLAEHGTKSAHGG